MCEFKELKLELKDKACLRIMHSADWHLGSSLASLEESIQKDVEASYEEILAKLSGKIRTERVDILLLAGDIFDQPRPKAKYKNLFQAFLEALRPLPVFIVAGNHDPLLELSVWSELVLPENVYLFGTQQELVKLNCSGSCVACIEGRSFSAPIEKSSLITSSLLRDEWWGEEQKNEAYKRPFHILLTHGDWVKGGQKVSHYNPIKLSDDLRRKIDFLALGHIHKQHTELEKSDVGDVLVNYPGFIQGRGFDELGPAKVSILEVRYGQNRYKTELKQCRINSRIFMRLDYDVNRAMNSDVQGDIGSDANLDIAHNGDRDKERNRDRDKERNRERELTASGNEELRQSSILYLEEKIDEFLSLQAKKLMLAKTTIFWRLVLKGKVSDKSDSSLTYLKSRLKLRGYRFIDIYDERYLDKTWRDLEDNASFASLVIKRYKEALAGNKIDDEGEKNLQEKALHYALMAHDLALDERLLWDSLPHCREYLGVDTNDNY